MTGVSRIPVNAKASASASTPITFLTRTYIDTSALVHIDAILLPDSGTFTRQWTRYWTVTPWNKSHTIQGYMYAPDWIWFTPRRWNHMLEFFVIALGQQDEDGGKNDISCFQRRVGWLAIQARVLYLSETDDAAYA
jgi:hypothetical protein